MASKKRILFLHDAYPNQLSAIHEYFQKTGEVDSCCLTHEVSRNLRQFEAGFPDKVFSFVPDGQLTDASYYFTGEVEKMARNSVNVLKAVKKIHEQQPLDLIVAHDRAGYPYLLYDALPIPVVGYSEFPDYKSHGWDPRYPPIDEQLYVTMLTQAYTYQAVVKSTVTIVPSEHARRMYPEPLQQKIVVQMDAFDAERRRGYAPEKAAFVKEDGLTYIGFLASALSSEKGLEHFIEISKKLYEASDKVRFVLIGTEIGGASYGFESQFLERLYGKGQKSFLRYLYEKYAIDESKYYVTGLLAGEQFSSTIHHVDFFLYPLQYGSANWGFFELLIRGKVVIASDRCFLPEIITEGVNGFMRPLDDHDAWCKLALEIMSNPTKYASVAERAMQLSQEYHVDRVAKKYMETFEQRVWNKS